MGQNLFNSVKMTKPNKNVFDLSHDVKLSCNMGDLIPTLALECVPGDKFSLSCESLLRLAPLVAPMMHRVDVYMHYFFVPNRITWPNWEAYITNDVSAPPFPFITVDQFKYNKLYDYLGIPTPTAGTSEQISALPFAAYNKIWNEYYRDQNLMAAIPDSCINGQNDFAGLGSAGAPDLQKRAWEHDYFTACLPFAQKGAAVTLPIAGFNDVDVRVKTPIANTTLTGAPANVDVEAGAPIGTLDAGTDLYAETSSLDAQSATINDLRRAFRLQEWLEKAARGGSRYVENILSHFGVRSSDKRLQRPEYITGTKSPIIISEVLNTTGTDDAPQGNMAGHGVSVTSGKYGSYYCEEHGYIIGIMSVMPKTAYQQGIQKHFLKITDPFEFYWPSFANIGEQPVDPREIWMDATDPTTPFGYVPRYAEYKFQGNRVAGDFRDTLNFWHMGRIFATEPALNEDFIKCDPTHRVFAVTDPAEDKLWVQVLHKISAVRAMPKFGTPSF